MLVFVFYFIFLFPKEKIKEEKQQKTKERITLALQTGMEVMDKAFEKLEYHSQEGGMYMCT